MPWKPKRMAAGVQGRESMGEWERACRGAAFGSWRPASPGQHPRANSQQQRANSQKMYEELLYPEEKGRRSEKYPKIFVGCPLELDVDRLAAAVLNLEQAAEKGDTEAIYNIFAPTSPWATPAPNPSRTQ